MSWNSYIYDTIKELQTFFAACVAFAAAFLAFMSQRYTANKQASTAITSLRMQLEEKASSEKNIRNAERFSFVMQLIIMCEEVHRALMIRKVVFDHYITKAEYRENILSFKSIQESQIAEINEQPLMFSLINTNLSAQRGLVFSSPVVQRSFNDLVNCTKRYDVLFSQSVTNSIARQGFSRVDLQKMSDYISKENKKVDEIRNSLGDYASKLEKISNLIHESEVK